MDERSQSTDTRHRDFTVWTLGSESMLPPVARRFVAGETTAAALEHVRGLNDQGIVGIVNRLGSHHGRDRAIADAKAYRQLVADVAAADLSAAVSVKPTQLGLDYSRSLFRTHLSDIVESGREEGVFVWLDMEEIETVDPTLDAFERLAREHGGGVGVCLQADLRRTVADLERLADCPGKLRLVKGGAYDRPADVAYTTKARINQAYRDLLKAAFRTRQDGIAVATHDPEMVRYAEGLARTNGTDFELQMLMGVRPDAQHDLASTHTLHQYVPYGRRWKRWCLNRARSNLRFTARTLLDGPSQQVTEYGEAS